MAECKECFHYEVCTKLIGKDKIDRVSWMCHFPNQCSEFKSTIPKTQADRIRGMSDEELAKFLEEPSWICANQVCRKCPLSTGTENCKSVEEWLKQPAEGE
jgi:hypothetical protein